MVGVRLGCIQFYCLTNAFARQTRIILETLRRVFSFYRLHNLWIITWHVYTDACANSLWTGQFSLWRIQAFVSKLLFLADNFLAVVLHLLFAYCIHCWLLINDCLDRAKAVRCQHLPVSPIRFPINVLEYTSLTWAKPTNINWLFQRTIDWVTIVCHVWFLRDNVVPWLIEIKTLCGAGSGRAIDEINSVYNCVHEAAGGRQDGWC